MDLPHENCKQCGLYRKCRRPFSKGRHFYGNKGNIRLILVGECFGRDEELAGLAFIGASGQLMEDIVKKVIPEDIGVYVLNAVRCAPYKGSKIRTPSNEEIQYCKSLLIEELLKFPEDSIIMTLGNTPLFALKGMKKVSSYIGRIYPIKISDGEIKKKFKLIVNFHPAYILRNPHELNEFASVFSDAAAILRGDLKTDVPYKILPPPEGRQLVREIIADDRYDYLYADIESSSIITKRYDDGLVVGVALTHDYTNENYYLPFIPYEWDFDITPADILAYKKLFKELFAKKQVIGHNIKFDIVQLKYDGYVDDFSIKDDTYVLAHIIHNRKFRSLTLKDLARTFFSVCEDWEVPIKEIIKKNPKDKKSYRYVPTNILGKYACIDVHYTKKLYHKLTQDLRDSDKTLLKIYKIIESEIIHWEIAGIPIDVEYLKYASKRVTERIESVYSDINQISEVQEFLKDKEIASLNVDSTPQLRAVLFDYLKFPVVKKTDAGNPSADKNVVEVWKSSSNLNDSQRKFIDLLLEIRDLMKSRSSYINTFFEYIDKPSNICRFSFHICGTVTGRISSPIHSLPSRGPKKELKRLVVSRKPNERIIISLDYSQLEPRMMASLSGEDALIEAYKKGMDIYRYIGSKVYNVGVEDIDKSTRQKMKAILLGIIYGKTYHSLARDLGISEDEAKQLIADFFRTFSKVERWINNQHRFVRKHKYIITPLGRTIPIPEIDSPIISVQEEALRKSQNYPIQSVASELALYNFAVFSRILREKFGSYVICSVHDSLVIDARVNEILAILDAIEFYLEKLPRRKFDFLKAPLRCDVSIGTSWGGSMEIKERREDTLVLSGYEEDFRNIKRVVMPKSIKVLERRNEENKSALFPYDNYNYIKVSLQL